MYKTSVYTFVNGNI